MEMASTQNFTVSLSRATAQFLQHYQRHYDKTRSGAVEEALSLLEASVLEQEYRLAALEEPGEEADWECTYSDGLKDETW